MQFAPTTSFVYTHSDLSVRSKIPSLSICLHLTLSVHPAHALLYTNSSFAKHTHFHHIQTAVYLHTNISADTLIRRLRGALTYLNFWRVVRISSGSGNRARWIMATQRLYILRVTPCALINLLGPRSKCSARLKIAWRLGNQRNNALLGRRAMHILMMMFFDLEHRIARAVEKRRPCFSACLFVCCAVGEVGRWRGAHTPISNKHKK